MPRSALASDFPISDAWKRHWFGFEVEFCGTTWRAAAEAVAAAVDPPASGPRIEWAGGDPNVRPGHYRHHENSRTLVFDARSAARHRGNPGAPYAWEIQYDSSVCQIPGIALRGNQVEIAGPICNWTDDAATLARILVAIRAIGARTEIDPRYVAREAAEGAQGLHIHVNAVAPAAGADQELTATAVRCFMQTVWENEPLLLRAIGIEPRRAALYTKRIPPAWIDCVWGLGKNPARNDVVNCIGDPRSQEARRHGLNLTNMLNAKGTIEFRYFNGALDPNAALAWVQLALAAATFSREHVCKRVTEQRDRSGLTAKQRRAATGDDLDNARFQLNQFMRSIGMLGDEFAAARATIVQSLPGNAAMRTRAATGARTWSPELRYDFMTTSPDRGAATSRSANWPEPAAPIPPGAGSPRVLESWFTVKGQPVVGAGAVWYWRIPPTELHPWRYYAIQQAPAGFFVTFTQLEGEPRRQKFRWILADGSAADQWRAGMTAYASQSDAAKAAGLHHDALVGAVLVATAQAAAPQPSRSGPVAPAIVAPVSAFPGQPTRSMPLGLVEWRPIPGGYAWMPTEMGGLRFENATIRAEISATVNFAGQWPAMGRYIEGAVLALARMAAASQLLDPSHWLGLTWAWAPTRADQSLPWEGYFLRRRDSDRKWLAFYARNVTSDRTGQVWTLNRAGKAVTPGRNLGSSFEDVNDARKACARHAGVWFAAVDQLAGLPEAGVDVPSFVSRR